MPVPLTARDPVSFTPPSLAERIMVENERLLKAGQAQREIPKIMIRVPTMYERDAFSAALVRGGVIHYSATQIRDLNLAGLQYLYDNSEFDRIAADLMLMWDVGDAQREATRERTDRQIELIEENLSKPLEERMSQEDIEKELLEIQPTVTMSETDRVRIVAIQQDITARYAPLQKAYADLAEQEIRRNWLCAEVYVVNWTGLDHQPIGNGRGGIARHEAEWLRGQIGQEAFSELGDLIFTMHALDGDEEKNLASLIESMSALNGSTAAASKGESKAGTSTDDPSTETPSTESPKTTDTSSSSTRRSRRKTAPSESSQTAAAS